VPVVNEEAFLRHAVNNLSIDQHRRDRSDLRKGMPIEELNARTPLMLQDLPPKSIERLNNAGTTSGQCWML